MRIHQNRIDAAVGVLSLTRAPKQGRSLCLQCSSCATPSRNPSPNPLASIGPELKPTPRHLLFTTTTVGAHRGAVVALDGLIRTGPSSATRGLDIAIVLRALACRCKHGLAQTSSADVIGRSGSLPASRAHLLGWPRPASPTRWPLSSHMSFARLRPLRARVRADWSVAALLASVLAGCPAVSPSDSFSMCRESAAC